MADIRTCYAGDLTSDVLGKRVKFESSTIAGTVLSSPVVGIGHRATEAGKVTTIYTEGLSIAGWQLDDTTLVEVLPAEVTP